LNKVRMTANKLMLPGEARCASSRNLLLRG
jgi:hypothetical protein